MAVVAMVAMVEVASGLVALCAAVTKARTDSGEALRSAIGTSFRGARCIRMAIRRFHFHKQGKMVCRTSHSDNQTILDLPFPFFLVEVSRQQRLPSIFIKTPLPIQGNEGRLGDLFLVFRYDP